ncbi:MAG: carboxymuconolactone decarboxylase family protein [Alphaproteobacteria bacterium]
MSKDYKEITKNINKNLAGFRKSQSTTMQGFSQMAQGALADGVLDKKTKELIALAIGVAVQCDGCIGFHTKALIDLGATREEVEEVLGMCVYLGGGPKLMYAADALDAFDQFSNN